MVESIEIRAEFQGLVECRCLGDRAVEDGLAIFVLTDLQIGRVGRRLDEIAGRIDHEQAQPSALDLTAEQHRHVERAGIACSKLLADGAVDLADGAADELRRLNMLGMSVMVRTSPLSGSSMPSVTRLRTDWLTARFTGGGDGHHGLAGLLEQVQLAKCGNVVDARIGAGIGDHHQTFADKDATQ